jgi:hypothetical protein
MRQLLFNCVVLALAIPVAAQTPTIFDVSNVVVGANKIPTLYLFAEGKWSDAGENDGAASTQIFCYKSLGFCEVANAHWSGSAESGANVSLTTFVIQRWDSNEIIAMEDSPTCISYGVVTTFSADLKTKKITLSYSDNGLKKIAFCMASGKHSTAVLWGIDDVTKDAINRAKSRQQNH